MDKNRNWAFELSVSYNLDGYYLNIAIPFICNKHFFFKSKKSIDFEKCEYRYGFVTYMGSIHFNWKEKTKIYSLPWEWTFVSLKYRHNDNKTYVLENKDYTFKDTSFEFNKEFCEVFPFKYVTKAGEEQKAFAKCCVELREWRRKWIKWLPINRKFREELWVVFFADPECTRCKDIGEAVDTWKGGTVACGIEIGKDETKEHALRRIEEEGARRERFQR